MALLGDLGEPESWKTRGDNSIAVRQVPGSMMDLHKIQSQLRNPGQELLAICVFALSLVVTASSVSEAFMERSLLFSPSRLARQQVYR